MSAYRPVVRGGLGGSEDPPPTPKVVNSGLHLYYLLFSLSSCEHRKVILCEFINEIVIFYEVTSHDKKFILIAKVQLISASSQNHNPHQNCLRLYFSTLQKTCQIQQGAQLPQRDRATSSFPPLDARLLVLSAFGA